MKIGPIDSHAHLSHPEFDPDRPEVISRAKEKGLQAILSLGTEPHELQKEITIAEKHTGFIYLGMGYHPHIAKDIHDIHYEKLQDIIQTNRTVLAIGEIGLDFYYSHSHPKVQEGVFREQLRLADRNNLPVIIHCRQAYPQLIQILKSEPIAPDKVLIHCFSGDSDIAKKLLSWGAMLSFAGPLTYPKSEVLRSVLSLTPLERLMAETDAPYLAPQSFRGKRNEPAYVVKVYEMIAQIKEMPVEAITEKIFVNFGCFFGLEIK
ncbi:MAG: TatD family hydrolase [bacterium]